jgi:hypothetical protein
MSGRVKFLPLAWAGMPKTSFRKNSDSPLFFVYFWYGALKIEVQHLSVENVAWENTNN